jgi:hypothetical protein
MNLNSLNNFVKNNPYAIAQGAGFVGDIANISNNYQRLNKSVQPLQNDAYGQPMYNFGQQAAETNAYKPHGAGAGEIGSATAQGALLGSSIPGVGTAIGAAAGFVGSIGASLFKNKQMEEEKKKAQAALSAEQNNYNTSMQTYNQNYLGRQAYEDQLKMYGLPSKFV